MPAVLDTIFTLVALLEVALTAVPVVVPEGFADVVVINPLVLVTGGEFAVGPPPIGAVVVPSISAWTSGLKVPVMPVNVNLEEKANSGNDGLVGSFNATDSKRMKYIFPFVPIAGFTVNWMAWVVETSTLVVIVCNSVCC